MAEGSRSLFGKIVTESPARRDCPTKNYWKKNQLRLF